MWNKLNVFSLYVLCNMILVALLGSWEFINTLDVFTEIKKETLEEYNIMEIDNSY